MRPMKELRVLDAAHSLTLDVYKTTQTFPSDERFALTSQLRRAAYSVPLNIAEGTARGDSECRRFLKISLGSAAELEYGVLLAHDLGYLSDAEHQDLDGKVVAVKKMPVAFIWRLDSQLPNRRANGQRPTANSPEDA